MTYKGFHIHRTGFILHTVCKPNFLNRLRYGYYWKVYSVGKFCLYCGKNVPKRVKTLKYLLKA